MPIAVILVEDCDGNCLKTVFHTAFAPAPYPLSFWSSVYTIEGMATEIDWH